jgi:hypothetical protein
MLVDVGPFLKTQALKRLSARLPIIPRRQPKVHLPQLDVPRPCASAKTLHRPSYSHRFGRLNTTVFEPSASIVGALFVLYLNFVVLIVQSFQKVLFLHALAPQQNEPPILATQTDVLVAFIVLTTVAVRRFHRQSVGLK